MTPSPSSSSGPFSRTAALLAVCGAAAVLNSGCTVGPDYTPPKLDNESPAAWVGPTQPPEKSVTSAAPPLDAAWWDTFNDPVLTTLVSDSLAANYDLKIAEARIRQARASRGIAASAGLPQVGSGASYDRSRQSENSFGGGFAKDDSSGHDNYNVGLDASWELDFFGGIRRSVEAAEADIQSAEETRRDLLVTLAAEVARNYIDVRDLQKRIVVTQDNVRVQTDTLELVRSRFNAGLVSELDVAQAEAQLATTTAALPSFQMSLRQAMHRIGVLSGKQPGALIETLSAVAPIPEAPTEIPTGLPSELLRRRPDIRRAERQVAAEVARIGVAESELFPRFSLTGVFGLQSAQIGQLVEGDSLFWAIGPSVRWPVFQGGRIRSNIKLQEAIADELLVNYQRTVLTAFEDVENALVSFNSEQARRRSLTAAVDADRRAVDLSNQLYRAGLADFQRVLDSQGNLAIAEAALAASDASVVQALVRLYKSLGGGWEIAEATANTTETQGNSAGQPASTASPDHESK